MNLIFAKGVVLFFLLSPSRSSAGFGECVNLGLFDKTYPELATLRKSKVNEIRKAILDRTNRQRADLEVGNHLGELLKVLDESGASLELTQLNLKEVHSALGLKDNYNEWLVVSLERVADYCGKNTRFEPARELAVSRFLRNSHTLLDLQSLSPKSARLYFNRLLKAADTPYGSDNAPLDYTLRMTIANHGIDFLQKRGEWRELYEFGDNIIHLAERVEGTPKEKGQSKSLSLIGVSAQGKAAVHLGPYTKRLPHGDTPESIAVGGSKKIVELSEYGGRDPVSTLSEVADEIIVDLNSFEISDAKIRYKTFELMIDELKKTPKFKTAFGNKTTTTLLTEAAVSGLKNYVEKFNFAQRNKLGGVGPRELLALANEMPTLLDGVSLPREYEAQLLFEVAKTSLNDFYTPAGNRNVVDASLAYRITEKVIKANGKDVEQQTVEEINITERIVDRFSGLRDYADERNISSWGMASRLASSTKSRITSKRNRLSEEIRKDEVKIKKWEQELKTDPNLISRKMGSWDSSLSAENWVESALPEIKTSSCDAIWNYYFRNEKASWQIAFEINKMGISKYPAETKMRRAYELADQARKLLTQHPDYPAWKAKRDQQLKAQ